MSSVAIQLNNISKRYYLQTKKPTLIEKIFNKSPRAEYWALKGINLTVHQGDVVGLIGSNGAGKTTLLRIIAGITTPTTGTVAIKGKVVSLIELTAGFQTELTGIENIYLNSILLGMSKLETSRSIDKIIEFADIGQFIDQPLYTYSEGMLLRLAMSVLITQPADIYVLDENLLVGDRNFSDKMHRQLNQFIKQKKTIILASHNMQYIHWFCKKIITLNHGSIEKTEKSSFRSSHQHLFD